MSTYKQLIRLKKWNLDIARKELVELETMREQILNDIEGVEKALVEEQMIASKAGMMAQYGDFANAEMDRRDRLNQSLIELADRIERKTDDIQDAFRELKTVEIAADRAEERAAYKRRRAEQLNLDEIAGQRSRRMA